MGRVVPPCSVTSRSTICGGRRSGMRISTVVVSKLPDTSVFTRLPPTSSCPFVAAVTSSLRTRVNPVKSVLRLKGKSRSGARSTLPDPWRLPPPPSFALRDSRISRSPRRFSTIARSRSRVPNSKFSYSPLESVICPSARGRDGVPEISRSIAAGPAARWPSTGTRAQSSESSPGPL